MFQKSLKRTAVIKDDCQQTLEYACYKDSSVTQRLNINSYYLISAKLLLQEETYMWYWL